MTTKLTFVLAMHLCCLTGAFAQDGDVVPLHDLLVSAKLPQGYQAKTNDVKLDGKVVGTEIIVSQPNVLAKVIVRIDPSNRSAGPSRRAATKAYINGFAEKLAASGFKVTDKKIPDISKEPFEKPVQVDLAFANADGINILTHHEIFFTDKGFAVQVVADDAATLAKLTEWAKTVKPKKKS